VIEVYKTYDKNTGRVLTAEATCHCGNRLDLYNGRDCYDTIDCEKCGRLYNSSGQELRPRYQWEENLEEDY
jgi:hypothetical protein